MSAQPHPPLPPAYSHPPIAAAAAVPVYAPLSSVDCAPAVMRSRPLASAFDVERGDGAGAPGGPHAHAAGVLPGGDCMHGGRSGARWVAQLPLPLRFAIVACLLLLVLLFGVLLGSSNRPGPVSLSSDLALSEASRLDLEISRLKAERAASLRRANVTFLSPISEVLPVSGPWSVRWPDGSVILKHRLPAGRWQVLFKGHFGNDDIFFGISVSAVESAEWEPELFPHKRSPDHATPHFNGNWWSGGHKGGFIYPIHFALARDATLLFRVKTRGEMMIVNGAEWEFVRLDA